MICRYCERGRRDVSAPTFMPDTCCVVVFERSGARWLRREDLKPSEVRLLLLGLTPASSA